MRVAISMLYYTADGGFARAIGAKYKIDGTKISDRRRWMVSRYRINLDLVDHIPSLEFTREGFLAQWIK